MQGDFSQSNSGGINGSVGAGESEGKSKDKGKGRAKASELMSQPIRYQFFVEDMHSLFGLALSLIPSSISVQVASVHSWHQSFLDRAYIDIQLLLTNPIFFV